MPLSTTSIPDLDQALKSLFGFDQFRALQREAVLAARDARDLLVVMPTGAGKSLCFQLPAAIDDGLTVVVSPLIALMRDQVAALQDRPAFARLGCACINSQQSPDEQRVILGRLREGRLRLVYVAPERFRSASFMEALKEVRIARFVMDEAHCISEWGHDFRPDYLAIAGVVESLGRPPLTAVTATATARVQASIVQNLGMIDPAVFIGGFNRPNLHFSSHRCASEKERSEKLEKALPRLASLSGSGLIYVMTRKQSEAVAAAAQRILKPLGKRAEAYHAGMDADDRNAAQSRWLSGETSLLVATNAFGMGIDKPDVRYIIHIGFPETIEAYYQEAGRAGRDGLRSRCVVLHHFSDRRTREWLIENEAVTAESVQAAHSHLCGQWGDDLVRTPRAWWSRTLGWSDNQVRLTLGALERAGVVLRTGESADEITLQILHREFPAKELRRIADTLLMQKKERYRRLGEMMDYLRTTRCRRQTILDYFGDRARLVPDTMCCDNCARPAAPADRDTGSTPLRDRVPMPPKVDPTNLHSILQGLDGLRPSLGKTRLVQLLRGSEAKANQTRALTVSPLFGLFSDCAQAPVERFLEALKDHGLVRQADEEHYFVWTVTPAGRAAWQQNLQVEVVPPHALRSVTPGDGDAPVWESLKQWRTKQARTEGYPPFMVFSDRALLEITRAAPATLDELSALPGLGKAKASRYGEAVLAIVREAKNGRGRLS